MASDAERARAALAAAAWACSTLVVAVVIAHLGRATGKSLTMGMCPHRFSMVALELSGWFWQPTAWLAIAGGIALGTLPVIALDARGRRAVLAYGGATLFSLSWLPLSVCALLGPLDPSGPLWPGVGPCLLTTGALGLAVLGMWTAYAWSQARRPPGALLEEATRVLVLSSLPAVLCGCVVARSRMSSDLPVVGQLQIPLSAAGGLTAAGSVVLLVTWVRLRRPPEAPSQG